MKSVAIIGAGASGLMCAIECAKADLAVSLFEQNNKCAKKILVSGNGRCNITNRSLSRNDYFGQNPSFVEFALREFGFEAFKKFANSIALLLDEKEDGRVYPLSNEAKSVAKLLEEAALQAGVVFHYNAHINTLKDFTKKYDAVVVATGSRAASHLGGSSDGEEFAKEFGHSIIPTYPSLVQLEIDAKVVHKMSGAKVFGEVTLLINHQVDSKASGDILFTNYGLSGFAILDISQRASEALLEYNHVSVSLNLLPQFSREQLALHIQNSAKSMPQFTLLDILIGLLPLKIASNMLDFLELSHATPTKSIHPKLAKKVANTIVNWRFEVEDTHGFRHAEVSGGGVNTTEINPKTFESYKQKNLYFTGEVLDVVGRRGGFNFAFAWASGFLAAQDIIKKNNLL